MKKFAFLFMITSILALSACGSNSESAVEGVYKAAVDHDTEKLSQLLSQLDTIGENDIDGAADELEEFVVDAGGVSKMEFKQIKRSDMNDEGLEQLNETYGKDAEFVVAKGSDNTLFGWIVKKVDGEFYVLDVNDMSEDNLKELLK